MGFKSVLCIYFDAHGGGVVFYSGKYIICRVIFYSGEYSISCFHVMIKTNFFETACASNIICCLLTECSLLQDRHKSCHVTKECLCVEELRMEGIKVL